MNKLNQNLNPLLRSFIGFEQLQKELVNMANNANHQSFPPYNIEQISENRYLVTLAIAGYSEDDISIELDNHQLNIVGTKDEQKEREYLHKGISNKNFVRKFQLGEHIEVESASTENGMLYIELENVVPEEQKPKQIKITTKSKDDLSVRSE